MARRGNNIHKRKDGRWEGRYRNGYKIDGSIKYSSVYSNSYSECKKKLIIAQSCIEKNANDIKCEKSFSDILYTWIHTNRIRIKGATEAKYIRLIETHIIPVLGGIKISDLNSNTINMFLDNKLKCGGLKDKHMLSASYVRTMAVIIESAIKYAALEGFCNPLKTPISKPSIPKRDIVILSKSAETSLTEKLLLDSSLVTIGVFLALHCGLRIGEVCALMWKDIDFDNGLIHIRHTVSRVPSPNSRQKTLLIIDVPKTNSSIRTIPIPSTLQNILLKAYNARKSDFVVSSSNCFVGTRTFDYQYRKLLTRYNIPIVSFHTLRHTYATRCAEAGIDAKTLSQLLGHASSNTSLNIYVHPSLDVTIDRLESVFCSA